MKVFINSKNHNKVFSRLKKTMPFKLSIRPRKDFFSVSNFPLILKRIADFSIEKDVVLEIYNVPLCFLLGYKRYLKLDGEKKLIKIKKCKSCQFFKECPGIVNKYRDVLGEIIKPIVREFTDLEKCMIQILEKESGVSTERVLKLAKKIKICASCNSEGEVFKVSDRLIEKGLIKRQFINNKYVWSLVGKIK